MSRKMLVVGWSVGVCLLATSFVFGVVYYRWPKNAPPASTPAYQYKLGDELSLGDKAPMTEGLVLLDGGEKTTLEEQISGNKPTVLIFGNST